MNKLLNIIIKKIKIFLKKLKIINKNLNKQILEIEIKKKDVFFVLIIIFLLLNNNSKSTKINSLKEDNFKLNLIIEDCKIF